jgi:hypothetical protein
MEGSYRSSFPSATFSDCDHPPWLSCGLNCLSQARSAVQQHRPSSSPLPSLRLPSEMNSVFSACCPFKILQLTSFLTSLLTSISSLFPIPHPTLTSLTSPLWLPSSKVSISPSISLSLPLPLYLIAPSV